MACFGAMAAGAMAHRVSAADNPLAPAGASCARGKTRDFLFMAGGVSHVDSFDYKQKLETTARWYFDDADAG